MLVLSRKCGESIVVGDNMTVTVVEVRGGRVKLGFQGSPDVPVHREEVRKRIEDRRPALASAECA